MATMGKITIVQLVRSTLQTQTISTQSQPPIDPCRIPTSQAIKRSGVLGIRLIATSTHLKMDPRVPKHRSCCLCLTCCCKHDHLRSLRCSLTDSDSIGLKPQFECIVRARRSFHTFMILHHLKKQGEITQHF